MKRYEMKDVIGLVGDFGLLGAALVVVLAGAAGLAATLGGYLDSKLLVSFYLIAALTAFSADQVSERLYFTTKHAYLFGNIVTIVGSVVATALIFNHIEVAIVNAMAILYWICLLTNVVAYAVHDRMW